MFKQLVHLLSARTKGRCLIVVALAFFSSYLVSVWPVLLGDVQTAIVDGSLNTFRQGAMAIALFALIYLAAECLTIARRVAIDCIIAANEAEIREKTLNKLLRMPVAYFNGALSGETTAAINQGVAGISQLLKVAVDVVAVVFTALLTLLQVFFQAPPVMVALMVAYLVSAIVLSVAQIWSQRGIRERIVALKNGLDGSICQSIANLELIRSLSAESYETCRLRPSILKIGRTERTHHCWMGTFDALKQACKVLFQAVILLVSIVMIANGSMTSGAVLTVCLLFQQLVKPIDEIYRFLDESSSSVIKAKALVDIADSPADPIFDIPATRERADGAEIRIDDVVVTNPEGTVPLAWFDHVTLPCDRVVALQGANGSGKSTLVRALNRYYPHNQGRITICGRTQESFSQQELTDFLYYSPQVSQFIAGTVRDNLRFGLAQDVDDAQLASALQRVHLTGADHSDTVIHADPFRALDTVLGEGARELSGGMRQRLALARAFLRTPRLFVFDEITANLDESATETVLTNIENYAAAIGAGIIYISHDPKVVARCQDVIVLHNKLRDTQTRKPVLELLEQKPFIDRTTAAVSG